jgi:uncharacterized protein
MPTSQKEPEIGEFCWIELGTTGVGDAKGFYEGLFDWKYDDMPMPDGEAYTMASVGGGHVAGMYELPEAIKSQGVPPHWMAYVRVDSADDTANKVKELGGQVMKEPFDVMGMGRMAVCLDPTGAAFALWQILKSGGDRPAEGASGSRCWTELISVDADASGTFFTELFGWTTETMDMGPVKYTVFKQGETSIGGMLPKSPEMGEMPSAWINYFTVSDCDATVGEASAAGGKGLMPAQEFPEVGRFTMIMDPQGAVFGILQATSGN